MDDATLMRLLMTKRTDLPVIQAALAALPDDHPLKALAAEMQETEAHGSVHQ